MAQSRDRRALVAVGNGAYLDLISRICDALGMRMVSVSLVQEALVHLSEPFDLVICEDILPDGDGNQVLLLAEVRWSRVTSRALIESFNIKSLDLAQSGRLVLDGLLRLPLRQTELQEAIEISLRRRGLTNTRVHSRYVVQALAEISIPGFGVLVGKVTDLSQGGLFVMVQTTTGYPQVGSLCHFEVETFENGVCFAGTGIVRWVREPELASPMVAGVGIQFCAVNEERLTYLLKNLNLN